MILADVGFGFYFLFLTTCLSCHLEAIDGRFSSLVMMEPRNPGREIANSHVPLAFLLGRRATEYRLPTLSTEPPRRAQKEVALFQSDSPHVRRREEVAKQLLERVLAQESSPHKTHGPLETPLARVSTTDRRRRADELQRVLQQEQETIPDDSTKTPSLLDHRSSISTWKDPTDRFASSHGFVPRTCDFVEVIGNTAKIQRTQSLRQLYDDEKRRQAKVFKVKRSRIPAIKAQLVVQQADTKVKLQQAEKQRRGHKDPHDDVTSEQQLSPLGYDLLQRKQETVKRWQDEQQRQLEESKSVEMREQEQRHEHVQRIRKHSDSSMRMRHVTFEWKKVMARSESVGPSFQSTLRVDPAEPSETTSEGSLRLQVAAEESSGDLEREENGLEVRLHERQYALFQKSRVNSLRFGGGFASKPRGSSEPKDLDTDKEFPARARRISFAKPT